MFQKILRTLRPQKHEKARKSTKNTQQNSKIQPTRANLKNSDIYENLKNALLQQKLENPSPQMNFKIQQENLEFSHPQTNSKTQQNLNFTNSQRNLQIRQKNSKSPLIKIFLKSSPNFAKESWKIWLFLMLFTLVPVLIAHYFLQNYLYMRPCEQCVYIRFDMLLVSFGAFLGFVSSKKLLKALAFVFAFYGCYLGLEHGFILEKIYALVQEENPFGGVAACKQIPIFPFDLPLHEYFSGLFMPSGECANDRAFVPKDAVLSPLQEFFIGQAPYFDNGIYSKGWYLLPYFELVNMPQACILIFCFALVGFLFLFMIFTLNFMKINKNL